MGYEVLLEVLLKRCAPEPPPQPLLKSALGLILEVGGALLLRIRSNSEGASSHLLWNSSAWSPADGMLQGT